MTQRTYTTGAIIVAAGSSQRMGGIDKLLQPLDGRPLIAYTIAVFAASDQIDPIAIVTSTDNHEAITEIARTLAPHATVVIGGERRRDSVRAGLDALADVDYIVVHDGARPLVSEALIERSLQGAIETGAAICAIPVTDTIKRAGDGEFVLETVDRQALRAAQTPQAFRRDLLLRAHQATGEDASDDASLLERLGLPITIVAGSPRNIKVTTRDDLLVARSLLQRAAAEE